jgi:hypothetical protein
MCHLLMYLLGRFYIFDIFLTYSCDDLYSMEYLDLVLVVLMSRMCALYVILKFGPYVIFCFGSLNKKVDTTVTEWAKLNVYVS